MKGSVGFVSPIIAITPELLGWLFELVLRRILAFYFIFRVGPVPPVAAALPPPGMCARACGGWDGNRFTSI